MITRSRFLGVVARIAVFALMPSTCLTASPTAAQTPGKAPIVGRLSSTLSHDAIAVATLRAFRDGMAALGHVEGRTYVLETRFAEGDPERIAALAADLIRLKPDVIVAAGGPAVRAAMRATATIPIVIASGIADAVGAGLVASLARPGGNVTGFSGQSEELYGKQLEFLRELTPGLSEVAVLYNSATTESATLARLATTGAALGLKLRPIGIGSAQDLEAMFARAGGARSQAMLVIPDPTAFTGMRDRIAALALRHRLPSVYAFRFYTEAGGLLSYYWDLVDTHRRSAAFVDKILKGAKPADLPVEQPTKFELVVNLKTAKALGITIPQSVLIRADEVIE
jgi:putative ABC transport system substrate-binding protein